MTARVNLEELRFNRGLSQRTLAKRIGISRETYRRAELGERPQARVAKLIADFFEMRPTDLWPVTTSEFNDRVPA